MESQINAEEKEEEKQEEQSHRPRRFFLITQPRTSSNLLLRILALKEPPNVAFSKDGGYFFRPVFGLSHQLKNRAKHVEEWTQEERTQMMQSYQNGFVKLEEHVEKARAEDKIVLVKEHSSFLTEPTARTRFLLGQNSVKEAPWTVQVPNTYAPEVTHSVLNETVLPDRDLQDVEAAGTEEAQTELALDMTLHWMCTLFDWYTQCLSKSESGSDADVTWPLVLEADDIMTEPEVIITFCEIVGMDATKLQFAWRPASEDDLAQLRPVERRMLSTLSGSAGIIKGKTSANLEIDVEAKKWREEFGEYEGEKMEKWVRAAMPDHEFMKAKRLRPRPI